MQRYQNLAGNSGVEAFELAPRSIRVRFAGGDCYLYTYASAGKEHVQAMKRLAKEGRGLSSYISSHVKDGYAARE